MYTKKKKKEEEDITHKHSLGVLHGLQSYLNHSRTKL